MAKYPLKIKTEYETFKKALETKENVFYENDEGDVMMYSKPTFKLISNNYFAEQEYTEQLVKLYPKKDWVWISKNALYGAKEIRKERGLSV